MKIPFVYRHTEGSIIQNGLSWDRNRFSTIVLIFKFYRLHSYFRIRPKNHPGCEDKTLRRIVFSCCLYHPMECCGVKIDFDTQSIICNGVSISLQVLDCLTNPDPNKTYFFQRVYEYGVPVVIVEESESK